MRRVAVYCGSSSQCDPQFLTDAAAVGRLLAEAGFTIVYGGGSAGLMGQVADAALEAGGEVFGFIPQFMYDVEWAHPKLTKLNVVETMHERKFGMLDGADAVLSLPGGTGTFEELFEALTLKRLGIFCGPILLLNTRNYYAKMEAMLELAVAENFMNPQHREMWQVVERPEEIVPTLRQSKDWPKDAIKFAAVNKGKDA